MPRDRRILALAFAAAALTALAGCGSGDDPKPAAAAQEVKAKPTKEAPAAKPRLEPELLKSAVDKSVLRAKDIGHKVEVQDQDDSLDVPTNDICAKEWKSNGFRVARHQDFFWKDAEVAELVVSTEVVAYEPGQAKAALAEIEKAIGDCDGWKHDQGEMDKVAVTAAPDGALAESFAWKGVDERKDGDYNYLATYQVRGDLLSAVYVWADDSSDAKEIAGDLTEKAAERLEKSG
ncbi:hypothetical protein [Tenggerimyces flavus]|uniref:PknH-like extracellular domain-containing protein n=1 Tax=Tenggerimyces flavus TaxID=1708749 RepID=A0ABV7YI61_9ACTN|nr:hypothetical protein [Tenggerimyces flavus]MBM7784561.1 putative small lipoprotein YifL [Tenggerimyces flavus]